MRWPPFPAVSPVSTKTLLTGLFVQEWQKATLARYGRNLNFENIRRFRRSESTRSEATKLCIRPFRPPAAKVRTSPVRLKPVLDDRLPFSPK